MFDKYNEKIFVDLIRNLEPSCDLFTLLSQGKSVIVLSSLVLRLQNNHSLCYVEMRRVGWTVWFKKRKLDKITCSFSPEKATQNMELGVDCISGRSTCKQV